MKSGINKGINPTNGHNPRNWTAYGKSGILETPIVSEIEFKVILGNGKLPELEKGRNRRIASERFFAAIEAKNQPIMETVRMGISSYSC